MILSVFVTYLLSTFHIYLLDSNGMKDDDCALLILLSLPSHGVQLWIHVCWRNWCRHVCMLWVWGNRRWRLIVLISTWKRKLAWSHTSGWLPGNIKQGHAGHQSSKKRVENRTVCHYPQIWFSAQPGPTHLGQMKTCFACHLGPVYSKLLKGERD